MALPAALATAPVDPAVTPFDIPDPQLLDIFKRDKRECFEDRWVFERQWTRAIHYTNLRQWLAPYSRTNGWQDLRTAKKIPRPVSELPKIGVQTLRALFGAIRFNAIVRPLSQDPAAVITASTADDLVPVLYDTHDMLHVMNEFDYWFVTLGNAVLHTYWDPSLGDMVDDPYEQCVECGLELKSSQIADEQNQCPSCQGRAFTPVVDPETGTPRVETKSRGQAVTVALSPLEIAFPFSYPRWSDVPFIIKMRWREKRYYEEHPELKQYVGQINWSKSASERSMQIFQSLPMQNDLGSSRLGTMSTGATPSESEGVAEYELWVRPTPERPEGFVARFAGDSSPIVLHIPSENLPGPLPYRDAKGRPLFTFAHACYEQVGGRVLGSSPLDPVIPKIDRLNRLDSIVEMIYTRMASPNVIIAKGSNPAWLGESPGLPGLIIEWDPLVAGENGKPEFRPGIGPDRSFFQIRQQLVQEIEEGMGTFDILKGQKPTGVEAFSALQLLKEVAQSRHASAFAARADVQRQWAIWALEMERAYGPDERTHSVMTPTRSYAFKTFKKAQLSGDFTVIVEDGSSTPKTSLGERAAMQQGQGMGLVDFKDPDQQYEGMRKLGLLDLIPTVSDQKQMALRKQESFEKWLLSNGIASMQPVIDPMTGQQTLDPNDPSYPLRWKRWYDPNIHRREFIKWCISDKGVEIFEKYPAAEGLAEAHLKEIDLALQMAAAGMIDSAGMPDQGQTPGGVGAGRAMTNSDQNSGSVGSMPGGPAMQGTQAPA